MALRVDHHTGRHSVEQLLVLSASRPKISCTRTALNAHKAVKYRKAQVDASMLETERLVNACKAMYLSGSGDSCKQLAVRSTRAKYTRSHLQQNLICYSYKQDKR